MNTKITLNELQLTNAFTAAMTQLKFYRERVKDAHFMASLEPNLRDRAHNTIAVTEQLVEIFGHELTKMGYDPSDRGHTEKEWPSV